MSGHTPGPWIAEELEKSGEVSILGPINDGTTRACDGMGVVALVDCAPDDDAIMFPTMELERIANARLIALAPEMFEYVASSASNGCATATALVARLASAAGPQQPSNNSMEAR